MESDTNRGEAIRNIWRVFMWAGLALVLALPALAMQLGAEGVNWTASDFAIMGTLLLVFGGAIEVVVQLIASSRSRVIAIGSVVAIFLAIWVELSVGIFGTPFAGS